MSRILIVDDDPDIIKSIQIVLESQSHEVLSALSGEEGLEKLSQQLVDLIILDIMMARADEGFDVCRHIKKTPEWKHIPVMLLTAIKDRTGFDFSKQAGDEMWCPADAYVEKPIDPDKLTAVVSDLIEKAKQ